MGGLSWVGCPLKLTSVTGRGNPSSGVRKDSTGFEGVLRTDVCNSVHDTPVSITQ